MFTYSTFPLFLAGHSRPPRSLQVGHIVSSIGLCTPNESATFSRHKVISLCRWMIMSVSFGPSTSVAIYPKAPAQRSKMASCSDMASGAGYCVSVEASNAGGVAATGGHFLLRGGLVGHAAAEQLTDDAGDARGARVAARQPARLLIVRLQQQQASCVWASIHATTSNRKTSCTT